MQCRLNQEKYLRKYSVKKHKEKPDRVYLAYKKVDNNRIEKEKRKVANDYLTQTIILCLLHKPPKKIIIPLYAFCYIIKLFLLFFPYFLAICN